MSSFANSIFHFYMHLRELLFEAVIKNFESFRTRCIDTLNSMNDSIIIQHFIDCIFTAVVPNFGGPTGSLTGGTKVIVQAAVTVGPDATLAALANSIVPGTLSVTETIAVYANVGSVQGVGIRAGFRF